MKVLVTGGSGFVAGHLARELTSHHHEVSLTSPDSVTVDTSQGLLSAHLCDLTDPSQVADLFTVCQPDAIVHLAGISYVDQSPEKRADLSLVNVVATHNLCAAASARLPQVTFLYVSSSMVYGVPSDSSQKAYSEQDRPSQKMPYGASKLAAENVCRTFSSEAFKPYIVRPFNHIGPGQNRNFVCPSFAIRVRSTQSGGSIPVGNLDSERDFTDVRDMVRAYRLILEKQPEEDLFVLGSGIGTKIGQILELMIAVSGKEIDTHVDPDLVRSQDPARVVANPNLARKVLGWEPRIPLETTIKDIYESYT